jgi:hypothetical protein
VAVLVVEQAEQAMVLVFLCLQNQEIMAVMVVMV